jgi:4-methyl-5(b-hydroxyethyl)-thiazole monophosphate biosynthesis
MGRSVFVLAGDGFEEMELVTPVDIWRRCAMDVAVVSVGGSMTISGAHGIKLEADSVASALSGDDFDALFLPGGPSAFTMKDDQTAMRIVKSFQERGKLICAICAAPLILGNAGILNGKIFCAHPCTYEVLCGANETSRVVVDGNLITAKGPGVAAELAFAVVEFFHGQAKADQLRSDLFF